MFIFEGEREKERESVCKWAWVGEGSEREADTESKAGSGLWAVSTEPDMGLKPRNHGNMIWAEVRRLTDWATQAPPFFFLIF